jgi:putative tricarboxylic transport membrane protein
MLMVKADSKFKSMKDVIEYAKANPKKVTVGGTQLGSSDSICAYLIEKAAGVQFNYIVFNSGGEVNAALMGGHVDWAMSNPGEALELAISHGDVTIFFRRPISATLIATALISLCAPLVRGL